MVPGRTWYVTTRADGLGRTKIRVSETGSGLSSFACHFNDIQELHDGPYSPFC